MASTVALAVTSSATERNDVLDGTPENDIISGRGGNDTISGRGVSDRLYGDGGNDVLYGARETDNQAVPDGNELLIYMAVNYVYSAPIGVYRVQTR